MTHSAKILADSMNPDGVRLTTLEVTFPRIVLAEFNTHRMLSRNSASSRAIPVEKMIRMVEEHPYIPTHWGKNQKGMQADEEVNIDDQADAEVVWLAARDVAVEQVEDLVNLGIHKQITNRLLEPFMWHTCIVSATEFSNFFNLRCHKDAHPEIKLAAELMRDAMTKSEPHLVNYGDWHLPLMRPAEELSLLAEGHTPDDVRKISVGRCARVSYLTHDGKRDPQADIELADRLLVSGHMSPFEHVARPATGKDIRLAVNGEHIPDDGISDPSDLFYGNFLGWVQLRKLIPHEHDILEER